eukprot:gene858-1320_t
MMAAVAQPMALVLQAYPYTWRPFKVAQRLIDGRSLSAATRLAEFESRLVWVAWLGFAAPPILFAGLLVSVSLVGLLKVVHRWPKMQWTDVCAIDVVPLISALAVCYAQAVAYWVDNDWEGTTIVIASPLPAGAAWYLVRRSVLAKQTAIKAERAKRKRKTCAKKKRAGRGDEDPALLPVEDEREGEGMHVDIDPDRSAAVPHGAPVQTRSMHVGRLRPWLQNSDIDMESRGDQSTEPRASLATDPRTSILTDPRTSIHWDFLGVPCYGVTSFISSGHQSPDLATSATTSQIPSESDPSISDPHRASS